MTLGTVVMDNTKLQSITLPNPPLSCLTLLQTITFFFQKNTLHALITAKGQNCLKQHRGAYPAGEPAIRPLISLSRPLLLFTSCRAKTQHMDWASYQKSIGVAEQKNSSSTEDNWLSDRTRQTDLRLQKVEGLDRTAAGGVFCMQMSRPFGPLFDFPNYAARKR